MATISIRKRTDGSTAYRVEIRIKREGKLVHREAKTFDKKQHANEWAKRREVELSDPGALEVVKQKVTISSIIDWYIEAYAKITGFGRSKLAHLDQMRKFDIAKKNATELTTQDVIEHVNQRRKEGTGPATVNGDLIWLRVAFKAARPALGLPLNLQVLEDASEFCRKQRLIARPRQRERRPTADEMQKLLAHFQRRDGRSQIPMCEVVLFAAASARREEEITRLRWKDNNGEDHTGVVRDAKHPTRKEGNNRTFKYTLEAWEIAQRQPKTSELIFPYNPRSIGAAFARACKLLEIDDLRFHDLRHDATSRLFEAGYSIVEVQQFTLHESWNTLKRYTHLKPKDVQHR